MLAEKRLAISLTDVIDAAERISPYIHRTPLMSLSTTIIEMIRDVAGDAIKTDRKLKIFLKCECFQKVGAFKFRGASNAVRGILKDNPSVRIMATHSSGNHAAALALASKLAGVESLIVVPKNASQVKVNAILGCGGHIVFCAPTEREAILESVVAEKRALHGDNTIEVIPPFDHPLVMAGQGTLALEILEDFPEVDLVICPIGGGGLISGVSTVIKTKCPNTIVIGVEPTAANDAQRSKKAGVVILNETLPDTIADGLRTNLGQLTWECIRDLVDEIIDVSEVEIAKALNIVMSRMKIVIEPSSATVVAALLSSRFWKLPQVQNRKNIVAVISGGNVDLMSLSNMILIGQEGSNCLG